MTGTRVLITGGGTGGHVYPALALAEALVASGESREQILFVGARRGLEATAVPAAGFAIELLPGRGLRRRVTWSNVGALVGTVAAFFRAGGIVARFRPDVVVGVGGYASLPCVAAARLRRLPVVVHEQNAAPGLANRIAVRLGARAAVALPGTPLAGATLVGNPVREAIRAIRPTAPGDPPLVLAFGGSLGARRINDAVLGLAERWRDRSDVRIRHVAGPRNHASCEEALAAHRRDGDALEYTLVGYEDAMERWYEAAAVVVCRAGAVTVAELAVAGLPSVLIPLPGAPADHQTHNAEVFAAAGAAVVVPDSECSTDRLARELEGIFSAPERRADMADAAATLALPDAAARLVALVLAASAPRAGAVDD